MTHESLVLFFFFFFIFMGWKVFGGTKAGRECYTALQRVEKDDMRCGVSSSPFLTLPVSSPNHSPTPRFFIIFSHSLDSYSCPYLDIECRWQTKPLPALTQSPLPSPLYFTT